MMKTKAVVALVLPALACLSGVAAAQAPTTAPALAPVHLAVSESRLTDLTNAAIYGNRHRVVVSPDSRHVAIVKRSGQKFFVELDGTPGKQYDWIIPGSLAFTSDSAKVAYVVQNAGSMFTVVGANEGKPYHEIVNAELLHSRTGCRIGYRARTSAKSKSIMVIDGVASDEYDSVGALGFSPDAKRVAFAAKKDGKQFFVVDGVAGEPFDGVIALSFAWSPDSKHFAYVGIREADKKVAVVVDGREQLACEGTSFLVFSPDSQHLAYAAKRDGKMQIIEDGQTVGQHDRVVGESVRFTPDSQHLGYAAARIETSKDKDGRDVTKETIYYVLDGKILKEHEALMAGTLVFSPDSKHWAYIAAKYKRLMAVVDGVEHEDYRDIRALRFSPDSKTLAYLGQRDNLVYAIINGKESPGYLSCATLLFSPDGKHTAWVASRNESAFAVLDGTECRHYTALAPETIAFSPDGRHFAYQARDDRGTFLVIDEVETPIPDGTLLGALLQFDSPTDLHTLILRNREIYRVTVHIN